MRRNEDQARSYPRLAVSPVKKVNLSELQLAGSLADMIVENFNQSLGSGWPHKAQIR